MRRLLHPARSLAAAAAACLILLAPGLTAAPDDDGNLATAIFAGGCFWCMEPPYDDIDGVHETISGYIGGHVENPTYQQVTSGNTGHAEVVKVTYDPSKVSYARLLEVFWRNIDPLTRDRQFCDRGTQYRSAIFYLNEDQRALAEATRQALEDAGRFKEPIVTEIVAADTFYPAEEYHQDYYLKNPLRYKFYRYNCGRDQRLKKLWGDEAGG
ncbi:MAG: peptide-methionine (S)-S-oxide reductase MsrA [Gammaproteobacteria bacterium]|nr:peptide-methionine (S)-S-oxide reductase MsrA [Gammaproteobacteria bacterium]